MVTGASNADLAIILVDARKGLLTQTLRHAIIVSLVGIHHVLLAVNKIDLVGFKKSIFQNIVSSFEKFACKLEFQSMRAVPISARYGDNVSSNSLRTPWYGGPHLLHCLEEADVEQGLVLQPLRMVIQSVNRPASTSAGSPGPSRVEPSVQVT